MTKPTSFDPDKMYRVLLSKSIRLSDGTVINPARVVSDGKKQIEKGSVRLRGTLCAQFSDAIIDAYETTEG